ncbi:hypothetical protein H1C71_041206 [Ictidomys tridecemlineatus]|nr:hypothetical protein H1C71_041206 [Ictidomys tridecemlineatus]
MHEVNMEVAKSDPVSKVFFEQGTHQCLDNCGTVVLTIICRSGDLTNSVFIDFRNRGDMANAGSDYELTEGTVVLNLVRPRRKSELASSMMTALRRVKFSLHTSAMSKYLLRLPKMAS